MGHEKGAWNGDIDWGHRIGTCNGDMPWTIWNISMFVLIANSN